MTFRFLSQGWLLRLVAMTTLVWSAQLFLGEFKQDTDIEFSGQGKFLFASVIESEGCGRQRAFRQSAKADPVTLSSSQSTCSCSAVRLQLITSNTAGWYSHPSVVLPLIRAPPLHFSA